MKTLLIFPPQWIPTSPVLSVPVLAGQLKNAGYDVKTLDLNIDFFNEQLRRNQLEKAELEAQEFLKEFSGIAEKHVSSEPDELLRLPYDIGRKALKYQTIQRFYNKYGDSVCTVIQKVDWAVSVLKSSIDFFNPEKLSEAKRIIRIALKIVSLPFLPNELALDNYYFNIRDMNIESIAEQCSDRGNNIFLDYYENNLDKILADDYDFIGISMIDLSQLISVFTLASLLKRKTKAHISIGGSYVSQIFDDLQQFPSIFDDYFDSVAFGDGERSIIDLVDCISGKIKIEAVPNILYKNNAGHIVRTSSGINPINMNEIARPCFDDYDFSKYFIPEPVFPIQFSKGCYWGKCAFCDYFFAHQQYAPKSIKIVIDEIKYYVENYNAKKFAFIDDAIPPEYYNRLALAIIESELDISFYSFARLEAGFSFEVLQNLRKAGAQFFMWGYECHSKRILQKMNKGIDYEKRFDILRNSKAAGIWNHGLFLFGFPTETFEEIQETMHAIEENRDIIHSCTLSNFALRKNSLLIKGKEKNTSISQKKIGDFYHVLQDEKESISQAERSKIRGDFQQKLLEENANSLWVVISSDFDHLLLYLYHHGYDYVYKYKSELTISEEFV